MSINRVRRIVNVGEAPTERDIPPNDPHYIDYRANKEHALSYIHRQKRPKTLLDILFPTPALSGTKRFILQTRSSVAPSRRVPNDFKGKFNIPRISEEKKQEAEEKLKRVSAKFVRRSGVNVDEAENNQSGSGLITGMGAQQGGRNYKDIGANRERIDKDGDIHYGRFSIYTPQKHVENTANDITHNGDSVFKSNEEADQMDHRRRQFLQRHPLPPPPSGKRKAAHASDQSEEPEENVDEEKYQDLFDPDLEDRRDQGHFEIEDHGQNEQQPVERRAVVNRVPVQIPRISPLKTRAQARAQAVQAAKPAVVQNLHRRNPQNSIQKIPPLSTMTRGMRKAAHEELPFDPKYSKSRYSSIRRGFGVRNRYIK